MVMRCRSCRRMAACNKWRQRSLADFTRFEGEVFRHQAIGPILIQEALQNPIEPLLPSVYG